LESVAVFVQARQYEAGLIVTFPIAVKSLDLSRL